MKNLMIRLIPVLALLASFALSACEKMVLDEETTVVEQEGNVTIKASMFNIVPFDDTRAVQDIADYCTRLCFVVYKDDTQVKKVLQKFGDANYGQVSVRLEPGTYQLLVLAHSGSTNPTLTHPDSLKFTNSIGYTDTFYSYGDLVVGSEATTHNVALQRATTMLRVIVTGNIPSEVKRIRLYYTGGTGVFNAVEGRGGTTKSKQHTFFDVAGKSSPVTLETYTFLREETGKLDVTITAYGASENFLTEKIIHDVPMKNHMVTEFSGALFSGEDDEPSDDDPEEDIDNEESFSFKAETSWEVFEQHTF